MGFFPSSWEYLCNHFWTSCLLRKEYDVRIGCSPFLTTIILLLTGYKPDLWIDCSSFLMETAFVAAARELADVWIGFFSLLSTTILLLAEYKPDLWIDCSMATALLVAARELACNSFRETPFNSRLWISLKASS